MKGLLNAYWNPLQADSHSHQNIWIKQSLNSPEKTEHTLSFTCTSTTCCTATSTACCSVSVIVCRTVKEFLLWVKANNTERKCPKKNKWRALIMKWLICYHGNECWLIWTPKRNSSKFWERLIHVLDKSYMRGLILPSCLCAQYNARARRWLA